MRVTYGGTKEMFCRVFFLIISFSWLFAQGQTEGYDFYGQHLIASYYECDKEALLNLPMLEEKMLEATKATNATVLSYTKEKFPGNGFSMVILVSESHSSIHTYPEHGACFVDIFTCGTSCKVENFDKVLSAYLKPAKVNKEILTRD